MADRQTSVPRRWMRDAFQAIAVDDEGRARRYIPESACRKEAETPAPFTALSNPAIGVLLLASGVFSLVASAFSEGVVLALMAVMCALAIPTAMGLDEVPR